MSSEISTLAWNARDAFSTEHAAKARDLVLEQEADVIMISEAASMKEGSFEKLQEMAGSMASEGYVTLAHPYFDKDERDDTHAWLALGRKDNVAAIGATDLGSRTGSWITYRDEATGTLVDYYGFHLDDRKEPTRQSQVGNLLEVRQTMHQYFGVEGEQRPAVAYGDMNSLHQDDKKAKFLRRFEKIVDGSYSIEPGEYHQLTGLKKKLAIPRRIGSLASRSVGMANGGTVKMLEDGGFTDFDTERQATKGPLQLDRIMATAGIVAVGGVKVHDAKGISDHKPISAKLRVVA